MRRMWWKVLLAASLCLNVGFLAAYGSHYLPHGHRKGMSDLNLSPEVQAKMEANFKSFRERLGKLDDQLRAERAAMLDLLASDGPSSEAVKAQQGKILALTDQILQTTDDHLLDQKRILTPAQQKLFFDHIRRRVQDPDRKPPFP